MRYTKSVYYRHYSAGFFETIFLSIPFYYLWNWLAPVYLPQLPPVYVNVPFWHCLGLFALVAIIRHVVFPNKSVTRVKD